MVVEQGISALNIAKRCRLNFSRVFILAPLILFCASNANAEEKNPTNLTSNINRYGTFSGNGYRFVHAATPMLPRLYNESGCVELGKNGGNSDSRIRIPDFAISKTIRRAFLSFYYQDPFDYRTPDNNDKKKILPNVTCRTPNPLWPYTMNFYIINNKQKFSYFSSEKDHSKNWFKFISKKYGVGVCSISLNIENDKIVESRIYIRAIRQGMPSSDEKPQIACMIKGVFASLGVVQALEIPDDDVLIDDYRHHLDFAPENKTSDIRNIVKVPEYVRILLGPGDPAKRVPSRADDSGGPGWYVPSKR